MEIVFAEDLQAVKGKNIVTFEEDRNGKMCKGIKERDLGTRGE